MGTNGDCRRYVTQTESESNLFGANLFLTEAFPPTKDFEEYLIQYITHECGRTDKMQQNTTNSGVADHSTPNKDAPSSTDSTSVASTGDADERRKKDGKLQRRNHTC